MRVRGLPFLAALLPLSLLAACAGAGGSVNDRSVGFVDAPNFPTKRIEIIELSPQILFNGRGYSFTATISEFGRGFDLITLPWANEDVKRAANIYCSTQNAHVSRFFDFSRATEGAATHTMFFNCE